MQTNIKEYDESFDLTQALQKKGTKEYGFIHLAQRANGSWVNIPIMLAVGAQDGPTLVVDACNHGDEYEGTEGIIKTFEGLDVSKMKGSFIGIPALNAEAFAEMKRYNTLDFVPQDLNRIYPGGTGPMTAYVCSWYCENIIKKADAVICIHGGGNSEYLEPVVLYCGEAELDSAVQYLLRHGFLARVLRGPDRPHPAWPDIAGGLFREDPGGRAERHAEDRRGGDQLALLDRQAGMEQLKIKGGWHL